jgi:hypothetical protein
MLADRKRVSNCINCENISFFGCIDLNDVSRACHAPIRILHGVHHVSRQARYFPAYIISARTHHYAENNFGTELDYKVCVLDSTAIDLSISFLPRMLFQRTRRVIKLHTRIDLCGPIPTFIDITNDNVSDARVLGSLLPGYAATEGK